MRNNRANEAPSAEGGPEGDGKTPQGVGKGSGEALAASPPARRGANAARGSAARDPAAETPGARELKFRDKKENKPKNPPRGTDNRALALAAGGKHGGSITTRSFCSPPLPHASAAVGDGIRGQTERGSTRSGRSPEVWRAPAWDGPRPRRGNSPRAAPGALRHLRAARARERNRNQDRLSLKYGSGSGSAPSFWVRLEEQHGLCGELTRRAHRDIREETSLTGSQPGPAEREHQRAPLPSPARSPGKALTEESLG